MLNILALCLNFRAPPVLATLHTTISIDHPEYNPAFKSKYADLASVTDAIKAATVVAISGYWYWSPFLVVRQLQSGAQKKDAAAFNEHVDYPKLRKSIKVQFSAMFADKLGKPDDSDNDFAKAGAALGTMIGMVVVNPFVDAMVQPETIMRAMQDGQPSPKASQSSDASARSVSKPDNHAGAEPMEDTLKWTYERNFTLCGAKDCS